MQEIGRCVDPAVSRGPRASQPPSICRTAHLIQPAREEASNTAASAVASTPLHQSAVGPFGMRLRARGRSVLTPCLVPVTQTLARPLQRPLAFTRAVRPAKEEVVLHGPPDVAETVPPPTKEPRWGQGRLFTGRPNLAALPPLGWLILPRPWPWPRSCTPRAGFNPPRGAAPKPFSPPSCAVQSPVHSFRLRTKAQKKASAPGEDTLQRNPTTCEGSARSWPQGGAPGSTVPA